MSKRYQYNSYIILLVTILCLWKSQKQLIIDIYCNWCYSACLRYDVLNAVCVCRTNIILYRAIVFEHSRLRVTVRVASVMIVNYYLFACSFDDHVISIICKYLFTYFIVVTLVRVDWLTRTYEIYSWHFLFSRDDLEYCVKQIGHCRRNAVLREPVIRVLKNVCVHRNCDLVKRENYIADCLCVCVNL